MNLSKIILQMGLTCAISTLLLTSAHAEIKSEPSVDISKKYYIGVKGSQDGSNDNINPAEYVGIVFGKAYKKNFALELDASILINNIIDESPLVDFSYTEALFGSYATHRYDLSKNIYFKSKAGLSGIYRNIEFTGLGVDLGEKSFTLAFGYGLGLGMKISEKFSLEADYTSFTDNDSLSTFSLTALVKF